MVGRTLWGRGAVASLRDRPAACRRSAGQDKNKSSTSLCSREQKLRKWTTGAAIRASRRDRRGLEANGTRSHGPAQCCAQPNMGAEEPLRRFAICKYQPTQHTVCNRPTGYGGERGILQNAAQHQYVSDCAAGAACPVRIADETKHKEQGLQSIFSRL
jgi:hypothetical protein